MNQLQRLALRPTGLSGRVLRVSPRSILLSPSTPSPLTRSASTTSSSSDDSPAPPLILPYKAKKVWPPDFTRLSAQEQLRFEKRYKRRVALRGERPRWTKFIKLVQLFSITFVVIYGVLFMEWDYGTQPFDPLRKWFWEMLGSVTGGPGQAVRKVASSQASSAATSEGASSDSNGKTR